jgi:hypothetical protein
MPDRRPDAFPNRAGHLVDDAAPIGRDIAIDAFTTAVNAARATAAPGPLILNGPSGTGRTTTLEYCATLAPALRALVVNEDEPDRAVAGALRLIHKYQPDVANAVERDQPGSDAARQLGEMARRLDVVVTFVVDGQPSSGFGPWFDADRRARRATDPFLVVLSTGVDMHAYWRNHRRVDDTQPTIVAMLPLKHAETCELLRAGFRRAQTAIADDAVDVLAHASGGYTDLLATYANAILRDPRHVWRPGIAARPNGVQLTVSDVEHGIARALSARVTNQQAVALRTGRLVPFLPDPLYYALRALAIADPSGTTPATIAATVDPKTHALVYADPGTLAASLAEIDARGFTTTSDGIVRLAHRGMLPALLDRHELTVRQARAEIGIAASERRGVER